MLKKDYASRLKGKLIEMQCLNLSDSEIERCFKNTVLEKKNIKKTKEFIKLGLIKL